MFNVFNFIGNVLLVSIPEEFFIAFLILYLVKTFRIMNHDFFDTTDNFKGKVLRLLYISVIPMSLFSNILGLLHINELAKLFICTIGIAITIMIYLKTNIINKNLIIFLVTVLSITLFVVLETITFLVVNKITGVSLEYFQQTCLLSFIGTLFERVIQYSFIIFTLIYKNSITQINILTSILKTKKLLIISTTYILIHLIILIAFSEQIFYGLFAEYDILYRVLITLIAFIITIFDLCFIWYISLSIQAKERYKYNYGKEMET